MNLFQLSLTLLLLAAATTTGDAAKKHPRVNVLKERDSNNSKRRKNRKLRNQQMRKLNRAMSIGPIVTPSPVVSPITTPSPEANENTPEPTPEPKDTDEPTPEPTPSPTNNECDDIDDVKETRSGVQYDLRRNGDHSCTDASGERYEYGEIDDVDGFDDCAETCVQDVPSSVLPHFRGIDFVCESNKNKRKSGRAGLETNKNKNERDSCRCLYDAGTLESNSRAVASDGVFDSTNTDGAGSGAVGHGVRAIFGIDKFNRVGTTKDKDVVCVKLESTTYLDVAVE